MFLSVFSYRVVNRRLSFSGLNVHSIPSKPRAPPERFPLTPRLALLRPPLPKGEGERWCSLCPVRAIAAPLGGHWETPLGTRGEERLGIAPGRYWASLQAPRSDLTGRGDGEVTEPVTRRPGGSAGRDSACRGSLGRRRTRRDADAERGEAREVDAGGK